LRTWIPLCLALFVSTVSAAERLASNVLGEVQSTQSGQLVLHGALQGDRDGTVRVTLQPKGSSVSGDWALTLFTRHADGSTSQAGVLLGRVTTGTVLADSDGVVALRDLELVLTDGIGEFEGLSAGDGSLDVDLGPAGTPFQASLSLTF
jgi:hypothetical protein